MQKSKDNTKTLPKTSLTQQLWIDFGRAVGLNTAIQLVWLNQFTGYQLSNYPQKLCNQKDTLFKKIVNYPP